MRNEAEDPGRCGTGGCAGCAGAADEFYVVQDVKTKKCTIVDKKPVDTSMTVVSPSGTIYKTRGSRNRDEDGQGLLVELTAP